MSFRPNGVLCRAAATAASWNKTLLSSVSSSATSIPIPIPIPSSLKSTGSSTGQQGQGRWSCLLQRPWQFYSACTRSTYQDTLTPSPPVRGSCTTLIHGSSTTTANNININRPIVRGHSKRSHDRLSSGRRRGREGRNHNDDDDDERTNDTKPTSRLYYQETLVNAVDPFEIHWLADVWTTPSRNGGHPAVQMAAERLALNVDQWKASSATLEALPQDMDEPTTYIQDDTNADKPMAEDLETLSSSTTSDHPAIVTTRIAVDDETTTTTKEATISISVHQPEPESPTRRVEACTTTDNNEKIETVINIETLQAVTQPPPSRNTNSTDYSDNMVQTNDKMIESQNVIKKPRPGGETMFAASDYYDMVEAMILENEPALEPSQTPDSSRPHGVMETSDTTSGETKSSRESDDRITQSDIGRLPTLKPTNTNKDSGGSKDERKQERVMKQESTSSTQILGVGNNNREDTALDNVQRREKDKATVDYNNNIAKGIPWWASRRLWANKQALR